ncbi:MAG: protein kinase, partial [Polyangiaceae bacterium]|nr:protein kinase [Polyangiaceae bacterium]
MHTLERGALLNDRYRLEDRLGEGSFSVVWGAVDTSTGRAVALKFLRPERAGGAARHRFLRELKVARARLHGRIVRMDDVIAVEGLGEALVMERLHGESLAARIARLGSLPVGDASVILVRAAEALASAHAAGVVHRDLSPRNIFLADGSDPNDVRLLDFGLAKLTAVEGGAAATAPLTRTGDAVGPPGGATGARRGPRAARAVRPRRGARARRGADLRRAA